LKEELLAVKVDAAAADLTPKDRDVVRLAIVQVYVLIHVLMTTDAHVGLSRGQQYKTLYLQTRHGVVQQLRIEPGHMTQVVELHIAFLLPPSSGESNKNRRLPATHADIVGQQQAIRDPLRTAILPQIARKAFTMMNLQPAGG
jgi:hypothetical protein